MRKLHIVCLAGAVLAASTACRRAEPPASPAPARPSSATEAEAAPPPAPLPPAPPVPVPPPPAGRRHPDALPALAAVGDRLAACPLDARGILEPSTCAPLSELTAQVRAADRGLATMVRWLDDPAPAVRAAAAHVLGEAGYDARLHADGGLVAPMLHALRRETSAATARGVVPALMTYAEARADAATQVAAFLQDPGAGQPAVRQEVARLLTGRVLGQPGVFDAVVAVAGDPRQDEGVRLYALGALRLAGPAQRSTAIAVLRRALPGPTVSLSHRAARELAGLGATEALADVLALAERDALTGEPNAAYLLAVGQFLAGPTAPGERKRALRLAETLAADDQAFHGARVAALNLLHAQKAPGFAALARKLAARTEGAQRPVAEAARALLAPAR